MRRSLVLVLLAVTGLLAFPTVSLRAPVEAATASLCGRLDLPETGLQGDVPLTDQQSGRSNLGYTCGVSLVGHTGLGGGSANMAWVDHCAYVASTNGIAVVDVSNPRQPVHVSTLHGAGSDFTLETIAAKRAGDRALLVAGRYGPMPIAVPAPMDIYDVTTCAKPKLVTTYTWPNNVHNLTFSPDATRVYSTLPLQAIDITDLAHPRYLGNLDNQIPQASSPFEPYGKYLAHEVTTSADGNTLYLGGQTPTFETFSIVDITGWPGRAPRVLSQVKGRGHSVRLATIKGRRYALHSEESIVDPLAKGCVPEELNPLAGAAEPWLSDVTDPTSPKMRIGEFGLAINKAENCAAQLASGVNASVHYHDVNNPNATVFGMMSMWNAGLRIVDLRDPAAPREVGYFNPGTTPRATGSPTLDKAWGHVRYISSSGHIWFATETGGFWVVELEPQVRAHLGLPAKTPVRPHGGPAKPGALATDAAAATTADTRQYYCTLGVLSAAVPQ